MNLGEGSTLNVRDVIVHKACLDHSEQAELLEELRNVVRNAPLFSPQTPSGKPMSVKMTSAGKVGWYADRSGYSYIQTHPSGTEWPAIPETALTVWRMLSQNAPDPDCCLINYYDDAARMGMHQDKDEADFSWPVVSISLGDSALFRIGNQTRGGKTESVWLDSGDVVVLGDKARLLYHGIDKVRFGSSSLLKQSGRLNLTMRVVF